MSSSAEESVQAERGYYRLSSLFQPVRDLNRCHRCKDIVYQNERYGPVLDVVFHKKCFRCFQCRQILSLTSFCSNQEDPGDREIYCSSHFPRVSAARFGKESMEIKRAIDVQNSRAPNSKRSDQLRLPENTEAPRLDQESVFIKWALAAPKPWDPSGKEQLGRGAKIDNDALCIKCPVEAQRMRRRHQRKLDKHHYPPHIIKKMEELFEAQMKLEEQMKKEEDELFQSFQQEHMQEKNKLNEEIEAEWEHKLQELTNKYEKEIQKKKKKDSEKKAVTIQFENQKKNLENMMSIERKKKKQTMTLRLREKEQQRTASMVKEQSEQMLQLVVQKREELLQEFLKEKTMVQTQKEQDGSEMSNGGAVISKEEEIEEVIEALTTVLGPSDLHPPRPPQCRKANIYSDASIFHDLDEQVIKVAENEQVSYTDLVRQLTGNLLTDLEKARAIYRWITVKDLNVMDFDDSVEIDTPLGLLRGIKFGTETYHVLFMRLCSYAGLRCVEIRGHSKSVGYEPGMKIQPNMFKNNWNAVLIHGEWWLVQCNWGARHYVLNKDKIVDQSKKNHIRYQYDEHYFMTDPDEFIQEFLPQEPEWQLLEKPITMEEFELLPFVRSVFFHYKMKFGSNQKAILETDSKGVTYLKIKIPEKLQNSLVFFYQLRFAEKDKRRETTYRGANIERFIFQTMVENTVTFSMHVPTTGEYFFEVFANKIDDTNKFWKDSGDGMLPFRLKCACKFKIICKSLSKKIHPLPNCASGEWGPKKAMRHFGIELILPETLDTTTSENIMGGILNVEEEFELNFKVNQQMHFTAKLRKNCVEDKLLDTFVSLQNESDRLDVHVTLPQTGQYGLDIYAKQKTTSEEPVLLHICKFLINCTNVAIPIDIPKCCSIGGLVQKDIWGPTSYFEMLGLQTLSHKEAKIICSNTNQITIELSVPEKVQLSCKLVHEPDEECRESISVARENGTNVAKCSVNMPRSGNYMFSLYAKEKDVDSSFKNVFNYMLKFCPGETISATSETKSEKSLLRKSLFNKKK